MPEMASFLLVLDSYHAHEQVRVATEVLCARVHDDIGAVVKWVLQRRGSKRRVNGKLAFGFVGAVCIMANVSCLSRGIKRRLQPDQEVSVGWIFVVQIDEALFSECKQAW